MSCFVLCFPDTRVSRVTRTWVATLPSTASKYRTERVPMTWNAFINKKSPSPAAHFGSANYLHLFHHCLTWASKPDGRAFSLFRPQHSPTLPHLLFCQGTSFSCHVPFFSGVTLSIKTLREAYAVRPIEKSICSASACRTEAESGWNNRMKNVVVPVLQA